MSPEANSENTNPDRLTELARQSPELARFVAGHPSAPAALLQELSQNPDRLTRQTLVTNPNAPPDVLLQLGREFPQELLDNPVFSLLWLERPNFLETIPLNTLSCLLELPRGQQELLEVVANCSSRSIRYYAARALSNFTNDVSELEKFADSPFDDIRSAVADNSCTPLSILERFATDANDLMRSRVARHPNATHSLLEKLAKDVHPDVRCSVARHTRSPELLEQLANDSKVAVRYIVASNLYTPLDILENYSDDKDSNLKFEVARNPNTSVAILEKLAQSSEIGIRRVAACHARMPVATVKILLSREAKWFRGDIGRATRSVEILERLARDPETWVRQVVAENQQTPATLLEKLAKDESLEVRLNVAKHPNTPAAVLASLARDRYLKVRTEVAKNLKTEIAVLKILATDRKREVSATAKATLRQCHQSKSVSS